MCKYLHNCKYVDNPFMCRFAHSPSDRRKKINYTCLMPFRNINYIYHRSCDYSPDLIFNQLDQKTLIKYTGLTGLKQFAMILKNRNLINVIISYLLPKDVWGNIITSYIKDIYIYDCKWCSSKFNDVIEEQTYTKTVNTYIDDKSK